MKIKLATEINIDSIVDGPGLRTTIFCQGCPHGCQGCHNPQTHDINGGFEKDIDELINEVLKVKLQTGVTFSGGDPFVQSKECGEIAKRLKENNINIWCYTGFLYEDLIKNKITYEFLKYVDVLVDGKFIEDLKSYDLIFKGSSNQRIIDVQKSLDKNEVILYTV